MIESNESIGEKSVQYSLMADPTIQTFCCHRDENSTINARSLVLIENFDTTIYNVICMLSSTLGMLGAIYQILPREYYSGDLHCWMAAPVTRTRRLIRWLAFADLLAAVGIFLRSAIWLHFTNLMPKYHNFESKSTVVYCGVFSALTQYFYMATWMWTLCYAIDVRRLLADHSPLSKSYHFVAWLIPAVLTVFGLTLLYYPDANCHSISDSMTTYTRILPNYIVTYGPILLVMLWSPCLYFGSATELKVILASARGQYTAFERRTLDTFRWKCCVINAVFYVCWLPNLVNGMLIWTFWYQLPIYWILVLWYLMALLNPLQALFNCLVYRHWRSSTSTLYSTERIQVPWRGKHRIIRRQRYLNLDNTVAITDDIRRDYHLNGSVGALMDEVAEQRYPLLQPPQSIINGYHLS